jgi:hypothetical protein
MAANDIHRALLAVEDVADRLRAAVARLRAAIKADTRILPPVPRRASPGGRWPEDLRRQLADALATRLPTGRYSHHDRPRPWRIAGRTLQIRPSEWT